VVIDAIRDEDGHLIGFAKITRDITERREAQLALEEARARFVQSQKMETVGQLTGGIAHDFNNLLAVVLGNLDLARKRLPDDLKLRQLIENSLEAAKRGASLTQRMLAFARRQELRMEPVDVPERVRNMAELLQGSIGPDIQINTQFPLRIRPAVVDANQLELAILNLAVNARDAMSEGGTLTIAAQDVRIGQNDPSGLKPGEYICLSVTDTGEGMDEETLKRAAEPFFTTKGIGKGTGLGLSMIHGFAEQSEGRLVLKSVKGKGTTAELWLPVADQVVQPGPEPEPLAPRQKRASRKLCVLVVDDDPLVLMNTAAMLEDLGHEVLEAISGEQALRMLRRGNGVDLVITDQLMPGMTGSQLIAVIRSERPELPIILATGYSEFQTATDASVPRLAKPFVQADLARAIVIATEPEGQVLAFRPK
jgi:CheY-like chemotaxis protein